MVLLLLLFFFVILMLVQDINGFPCQADWRLLAVMCDWTVLVVDW